MSEWSAGPGGDADGGQRRRADGGDDLFESLPDPAVEYATGEPATVRRTNPAFESTFGVGVGADEPLPDLLDATAAGDGDWTAAVIDGVRAGETAAVEGVCGGGERSWTACVRVLPADGGGYLLYTDLDAYEGVLSGGEKLEEFASIVSHDLRNPLEVANIHLEAAQRTGDDEHFEKVAKMHDRIENIIEDVLQLTRGSAEVDTSQVVELAAVAEEAWGAVRTDDRTLTVEGSLRLYADENRLQTILENLFRNAVEHAGPGTAVTVGPLDDGFYVEDDGPGIPEAEREQVFEPGFSEADDGTGLGLAIVRRVAEAHGWAVRLAESDAGGVRFEFSGVEFPD